MKIAYDEAVIAMLHNEGGPFGAVITQGDKLIAQAHNQVLLSNDPTAHAEINVIRKASEILGDYDLSSCTLYTSCKPCPMCLGAIFWARIPTVYYGASEEDAQKGGFDDLNFYEQLLHPENHLSLIQIDQEKNARLFEQWLNKPDKQLY